MAAQWLDHPLVARFDAAVDEAFEPVRANRAADRVMYALSELGDFSLIWHIAAATTALVGSRRSERAALRLSVVLGIESVLVNGVIKGLIGRSRPAVEEPRTHRLRTPRTSSFPSGHASAAACAATLMVDAGQPALPWVAAATAVATSRIHVRIHHASDVAAGALVGLVVGRVAVRRWPLR